MPSSFRLLSNETSFLAIGLKVTTDSFKWAMTVLIMGQVNFSETGKMLIIILTKWLENYLDRAVLIS